MGDIIDVLNMQPQRRAVRLPRKDGTLKTHEMLTKAVENNIDWCDAVAKSHNLLTVRTDSMWYCAESMPPLYPNAITRHPAAFNPALLNDLLASVAKPWLVKDSFFDFDSALQANVAPIFSAHWYGYQPQENRPTTFDFPSVEFVRTADDLKRWLAAWRDRPENKMVFNEALLKASPASFVYLTEFGNITCGAALYASQGVVGVSNFFGSVEEQQRLIRTIQMTYPNETIVGYGDEAELTLLKPFGFVELGRMNVMKAT